jgi:hypothetical protein
MPDRGSRKALEWIQGMPFHPVREELELQARIAEHPLPWRAPKTGRRIAISTDSPRATDLRLNPGGRGWGTSNREKP